MPGRALIEGSVADNSGEPVEGTVVVLEAWPSGDAVKSIAVGETIPVAIVAKTVTDENSLFELRSAETAEVEQFADDDVVNFQLVAQSVDGPEVLALSGEVSTAGNTVMVEGSALRKPVELTVDEPAAIEDLIEAEEVLKSKTCSHMKVADLPDQKVTLARVYSTTTKVTTDFTLAKGASASLGVAASTGGAGFKASGSSAVKVGTKTKYYTKDGKHATAYQSYADYYKARQQCIAHNYTLYYTDSYRVVPVGLEGSTTSSLSLSSVPSTKIGNCIRNQKGFELDSGKNTTWSTGVSIKAKIGIDLSAQAGWDSNMTLDVNNKTKTDDFQVCGTKAKPRVKDPGEIVIKAYSG